MKWFLFLCMLMTPLFSDQPVTIPLDGELMVVDPNSNQLHVDGEGRIYLSDRNDYSILVISADGRLLGRMGRRGEGPGEFKRWFGEFTLTPDNRVAQVDFWSGNGSISFFSYPDGYRDRVKIQLPGQFGPNRIFPLGKQGFLLGVDHKLLEKQLGHLVYQGATHTFFQLDALGKVVREFFSVPIFFDFSDTRRGDWPALPFRVEPLSAFHPATGTLAFQKSNETVLRILNVREGTERTVPNGFHERPLDKALIGEMIRDKTEKYQKAFQVYLNKLQNEARTIETLAPIVDRLFFSEAGYLYVAARPKDDAPFELVRIRLDTGERFSFRSDRLPALIASKRVYYLIHDQEEDQYRILVEDRTKPWL